MHTNVFFFVYQSSLSRFGIAATPNPIRVWDPSPQNPLECASRGVGVCGRGVFKQTQTRCEISGAEWEAHVLSKFGSSSSRVV